MIRLHLVVEGQTEETFAREVLAPNLGARQIFLKARRIETGRRGGRVFRGGFSGYQQLKDDLSLWMKEDQNKEAWFTTMIDLYALPKDFPGYQDCATRISPIERVECLELAFEREIQHRRFIPYIQLHEFEALLFSAPAKFAVEFPGDPAAVGRLEAIRKEFPSPEYINDRLPPSKRIQECLPDYRKTVAGPVIAKAIDLIVLRQECRHFDAWMRRIENAGSQDANR